MLSLLATWTLILVVAVLFTAAVQAITGPETRAIRGRRRHAERTACAMRRMTKIRRQTIRRMDAAEGRWRP
jgi:hypothetical protein